MADELMPPFELAVRLDRSTATIIRWARRGLLPGAVFIGSCVWFHRTKIEEFLDAGGTPRRWPEHERERFVIRRHGSRSHAGAAIRSTGGTPPVTIDAERTVKRGCAEGQREPGQGPVGYEPRFLTDGRNVTENHPWNPKVPT
jgi:hypothetical protein